MMKKLLFIILAIVAIGAYFALNKTKEDIDFFSGSLPLPNSEGVIIGKYSIKDILDENLHYECSFLKAEDSSRVQGHLFISDDGKVRGDFDIDLILPENSPSETPRSFASHLILRDDLAYTWTSLQPIGYKTKIAESALRNASPTEQAQIVGTEDRLDYECREWNANMNVFELPTGINFAEI